MMDPFQQQVMMQGKPQQQQMGGHPQVVQGQVVGAGEGAVTEVALEGFRAGVFPRVPGEFITAGE